MEIDTIRLILSLSIGGTALALLLILLRRIFSRRLSSQFYYYAWLLVLLRMVIPMPGLMPSADRAAPIVTPAAENRSVSALTPIDKNESFVSALSPAADSGGIMQEKTPTGSPLNGTLSFRMVFTGVKELLRSPSFWVCLWATGALLSLLWHLWSYFHFSSDLRQSIQPAGAEMQAVYERTFSRPLPRLVKSPLVDTPILIGLFKPLLVLPEREFSSVAYENILRHEITHYRRADLLFKWFSVLVFSLHWFNPLTRCFSREINMACELSCDEKVLRNMDDHAKRDYGEMLLDLANAHILPKQLVFTSLATEKNTLKERLEQIMNYKKKGAAALLLSLALAILLCGCAAVLGPQSKSPSYAVPPAGDLTENALSSSVSDRANAVSKNTSANTVDEFLASLSSHSEIFLEEGYYDLTTAADYGKSYSEGPYTWEPVYDGYQLVIRDLEGLSITGASPETTEFVTQPRHACVLVFDNCSSLTLSGFTAGHTERIASSCEGDVIEFNACREAKVSGCHLYGCGEIGITALNSRCVFIENSLIYECSNSAVWAEACQDVRVTGCSIYDIKKTDSSIYRPDVELPASTLFYVQSSRGFALVNCEIYDNIAFQLLDSLYSKEVYLLGCSIENNQFLNSLLALQQYDIILDGCSISGTQFTDLYSKDTNYNRKALSQNGSVIERDTLIKMQLEKKSYNGPIPLELPVMEAAPAEDGTVHVYVKTVDEFLAAIAPNTTIHLDSESFDLSGASEYGSGSSDYYFWELKGDGPELVISGVSNFHIDGKGKEQTGIYAAPRTANVLHFYGCETISVCGITAGHSAEDGACQGGVLDFLYCSDITIEDCGLFGCGILGVSAQESRDIQVIDTEIYECSQGAARFYDCENISFSGCNIHDCPTLHIVLNGSCRNASYDGVEIKDSYNVG